MIICTNFKNYPSSIGENALSLAKIHAIVQKKNPHMQLSIAVNAIDLKQVLEEVGSSIRVFAQHADNAEFGSSTGSIIPTYLKMIGCTGVILNHSEKRFVSTDECIATIANAKSAGLMVICCAETAAEGKYFSENSLADYIAIEPPELIGGDISVAMARPELIDESVKTIGQGKVLIGAGIKTGNDIAIAKSKGAVGVLLASGITKSENPEEVLMHLCREE